MTYLQWYAGMGVAVLAVVLGTQWNKRSDDPPVLRDLLDALHPERLTLPYRLINKVLVPVLASAAIFLLWPVAIYMKGRDIFRSKSEPNAFEIREFAVEKRHLLQRLNIDQVEAREVIQDPLCAVPIQPFGHLNIAWKRFLEGVEPNDEIWSFSAVWQTPCGHKELRLGYVVLRSGSPGSYFLTVCKQLSVGAAEYASACHSTIRP